MENSELLEQNDGTDEFDQQSIQMQNQRQHRRRYENVLEAQIQPGDTLQAIALRYNCTVSTIVVWNIDVHEWYIAVREWYIAVRGGNE